MVSTIRKRDGRIENFDKEYKIRFNNKNNI